MQARAKANQKIHFIWDTVVEDVLGEKEVEGVVLRTSRRARLRRSTSGGFFVAIGHKPNTGIFKGWLDMDELGYIRPGRIQPTPTSPAFLRAETPRTMSIVRR